MVDFPPPWSLRNFEAYLDSVFREVCRLHDPSYEDDEISRYSVTNLIHRSDDTIQIDLEVDLSAIGLSAKSPITVISNPCGPLAWFMDTILIVTTPRDWAPEQAADTVFALDHLVKAHGKWVSQSAHGGRGL